MPTAYAGVIFLTVVLKSYPLSLRHLQAVVRGAVTCIDHNFNVNRKQVL
jgi:hypothetical protein